MRLSSHWFRDLYQEIHTRYEQVNCVITLGQDRRWRFFAAYRARLRGGNLWLDLCSGTGDMACALRKVLSPRTFVIALDLTPAMLQRAREKCTLSLVEADAASLPFPSNSLDGVTLTFASRNLLDAGKLFPTLREIYRVLKPGGILLHLESSRPHLPWAWVGFRLWSHFVIPWIGTLLSGNREGYRYLGKSLRLFPSAPDLAKILEKAGFRTVRFYPLFLGAVALHEAIK